jgi:hypothetical protein
LARIGKLSADRNVLFSENEIRNLSEAMTGREIGADYFDVALPKNIANVSFGLIFHTHHYTCRATRYSLLIPVCRAIGG